jgi:hypothetical protein
VKSRLGTSWVVGTPISKEVFRWFYLGISAWGRRGPTGDGWPPSERQPGGRGAKGLVGASEYNNCARLPCVPHEPNVSDHPSSSIPAAGSLVTCGSDRGCPVDAFAALYYHGPLAVFVSADPREHAWRGE